MEKLAGSLDFRADDRRYSGDTTKNYTSRSSFE